MVRNIKDFIGYKLRFNKHFKLKLKEVLDHKEWDYQRLKNRQNDLFLKVLHQAVSQSPFYQRLYAEHGVNLKSVGSIDDIVLLPIITKDDVRKHLQDIHIGNSWIKAKGYTSGTSGTPLVVYRDYWSTIKEGAYIWAQRAMFGFKPGIKVVSLRGNLDRSEMRRYDRYSNCLYLSSFNLREENADWYCKQIQQYKPYAILAYSSSVEILANYFLDRGLTVEVPYIFTSSEQVYEHQRAKVEKVFNTKIVDWYGNAERTIALEQRPDSHYYELPLYSVNEYEEDRTITTGLISASFPLIRYQVDDVIVPQKNRKLSQIKEIMGRHDDVLLLPDGTRVGRIGAAFLDIIGLELAQIRQNTREKFVINLVVNERFDRKSLEKIQSSLSKLAGDDLEYDIVYVRDSDIVRTRAGKFKLVISEVCQLQGVLDQIESVTS